MIGESDDDGGGGGGGGDGSDRTKEKAAVTTTNSTTSSDVDEHLRKYMSNYDYGDSNMKAWLHDPYTWEAFGRKMRMQHGHISTGTRDSGRQSHGDGDVDVAGDDDGSLPPVLPVFGIECYSLAILLLHQQQRQQEDTKSDFEDDAVRESRLWLGN